MTLTIYTPQYDKGNGFSGECFVEDEHGGKDFHSLNEAMIYLENAQVYIDSVLFCYSKNGEHYFRRFNTSPVV